MNTALEKIAVIIVAGGTGSRMKSDIPKQFLKLNGKPIAAYSLELFSQLDGIHEIVVVCDKAYRGLIESEHLRMPIKFALPGKRRQDSALNGFKVISPESTLVVIHDAARPFITREMVLNVISSASIHGASTAAMPVKSTIKQADQSHFVSHTPDRSSLWEIQTPQAIRPDLLAKGFNEVAKDGTTVTDEVSLIERLNLPVKLVEGSYMNIKITTPEDLIIANHFVSVC